MRATLTFTAAVALCFGVVSLTAGNAADAPSAAQIIDKLSPTGGMTTRGIKLKPAKKLQRNAKFSKASPL